MAETLTNEQIAEVMRLAESAVSDMRDWEGPHAAQLRRRAEFTAAALRELLAAREKLAALEGRWLPMNTAPLDGSEVLLLVKSRGGIPGKMLVGHWMPGGHCIEDHPAIDEGWYFWNGCMFDRASKPTRWQPLPEPPQAADELHSALATPDSERT